MWGRVVVVQPGLARSLVVAIDEVALVDAADPAAEVVRPATVAVGVLHAAVCDVVLESKVGVGGPGDVVGPSLGR